MIAGLGNPESKYNNTRHNAGFAVIDALCRHFQDAKLKETKFHGAYTRVNHEGEQLILLKPLTYMNLSGDCIAPFSHFYRIPVSQIIVVSDEISFPEGQLRVRPKGSAGGHNGLKSVIARLGSEDFPRVRVGVGQKPERMDLAAHVLSKFSKEEQEAMEEGYRNAADACLTIISEGCEKAMNRFNAKIK